MRTKNSKIQELNKVIVILEYKIILEVFILSKKNYRLSEWHSTKNLPRS
jgi:hypothetical protein